jgi:hypothetical protein
VSAASRVLAIGAPLDAMPFRVLLCALSIGALLLALPTAARADSAPGNALNPTGGDTTRSTDDRGMSQLQVQRRRSPAGFLYPDPLQPDRFSTLGGDWLYRGSVEFGGLWSLGDDRETRFHEYADWNDGAFLESVNIGVANPTSGFFTEVAGGGAGRDDQYFYGEIGVAGLVRLRGSFSGIPHTFATDATNLYRGAGSGVLRLPPSLTPGNNTDPEIIAALEGIGQSELSLQRNRTQLSLDYRPRDDLTLFARYSHEDRDGSRPFGGSLIFDSGGEPERVVETTEPRDHRTHNTSAGLQFRSSVLLANVEYNGSIFRNGDVALSWDNPFLLAAFNGAENIERGRFALAPDNHWHNVKADVSVSLPWKGRLTTTASWGRMRQDDDLIAPTVNSGLVGSAGFNGVDLNDYTCDRSQRFGSRRAFAISIGRTTCATPRSIPTRINSATSQRMVLSMSSTCRAPSSPARRRTTFATGVARTTTRNSNTNSAPTTRCRDAPRSAGAIGAKRSIATSASATKPGRIKRA